MAVKWVATTGSDAADGSSATPWLTIKYAMANASSGDTIKVRPGTYDEAFNSSYGLNCAYGGLTLQAVDADDANATSGVTITAVGCGAFMLYGHATGTTVTWNGFTFDLKDTRGAGGSASVKNYAIQWSSTGGLVVENNCTWIDSTGAGAIKWITLAAKAGTYTSNNCRITGKATEDFIYDSGNGCTAAFNGTVFAVTTVDFHDRSGTSAVTITGATGTITCTGDLAKTVAGSLTLTNCNLALVFVGYGFRTTGDGSFSLTNNTLAITGNHKQFMLCNTGATTNAFTLTGNTITDASTQTVSGTDYEYIEATGTGAHTLTIIANRFHLTSTALKGSKLFLTTQAKAAIRIEHNWIYHGAVAYGGIQIVPTTTAVKARVIGNRIMSAQRTGRVILIGVDSNTDAGGTDNYLDGSEVKNNVILGPRWFGDVDAGGYSVHGIEVGCSRADCTDNLIYGCGYGLVLKGGNTNMDYSAVNYEACARNIFVDNDYYGVLSRGCKGIRILNNTVVNSAVTASSYGAGVCLSSNEGNAAYTLNVVVRNNILADYIGSKAVLKFNAADDATGAVSDYNLIWANGGALGAVAGDSYSDIDDWRLNTSLDAASVASDPMFESHADLDFRLKIKSPAIRMTAGVRGLDQIAQRHAVQAACGAREVAWDRYFKRRGERL